MLYWYNYGSTNLNVSIIMTWYYWLFTANNKTAKKYGMRLKSVL